MTAPDPVGYEELDELVHRLRLGTTAAELHGSVSGFIAGGGQLGTTPVLSLLQLDAESPGLDSSESALLDTVAQQCRAQLDDSDLGFEPLLPADDRPLPERADALVDWCRGFLGGFGLGGSAALSRLSEEAQEILRDLAAIGASALELGEESDDEDALIEVHEFVRMGAMLLFSEVNAAGRSGPSVRVH